MQLRNWSADGFVQDDFQLTRNTTIQMGLRYEYTSPLIDIRYTNSNLIFSGATPQVFIGGQNGYPGGLMYSNKRDFAPRLGLSRNLPRLGLVFHGAYGIFFTPVDLNTWCNQRHNVPYVFPETQQFDNFTPPATLLSSAQSQSSLNFAPAVLGKTTVSFTAFDPTRLPSTSSSGALPSKRVSAAKPLSSSATSVLAAFISSAPTSSTTRLQAPAPSGPAARSSSWNSSQTPACPQVSPFRRLLRQVAPQARFALPSAPSTCSPTPRNPGTTPAISMSAADTRMV